MVYISNDTEETKKIGYELARKIDTGELKSRFIAMRGEMGVGKTAFTSGFASYFGIKGVKSPTYAVMNQHTSPTTGMRILHFDTYRISDDDDLYSIGFYDYLDSEDLMIVEWSENIDYAIPDGALYVKIERIEDNEGMRKITVSEDLINENISI